MCVRACVCVLMWMHVVFVCVCVCVFVNVLVWMDVVCVSVCSCSRLCDYVAARTDVCELDQHFQANAECLGTLHSKYKEWLNPPYLM